MHAFAKLPIPVIILLLFCFAPMAPDANAQGYITGEPTALLASHPAANCGTTWYNPSLMTLPNGDLGFIAQSGRPPGSSCPTAGLPLAQIDDFYSASLNPSTGNWTVPSVNSCPTLKGAYNRCGYVPSGGPPGPIGNPSVVKVGSTYYMAFNGGNADYIAGRIYWASSTDGVTWNVYNLPNPLDPDEPTGEGWTPILKARYHNCVTAPPALGIGEINLAYQPAKGSDGTFYIYFNHYGFDAHGFLDTWGIRFSHDPSQPFGLGGNKQIYQKPPGETGAWKNLDSGLMVWNYDITNGGSAMPGEPVLGTYQGRNGTPFGFGSGEIRYDPLSRKWLHVYTFGDAPGNSTKVQTSSSLSSNLWTTPVTIDDASLRSLVPAGDTTPRDVGLHHGTIGGRTGLWMFAPMNIPGCSLPYPGLQIVPAELCTDAAPTLSTVSPTSGSTGGGTLLTVNGNNLDCASSVKFGGTNATILSRTHNKITLSTPAHGAGVVNVQVTTPSGTATKTSAFTYTGPPAYGGFHDTVGCYGVTGWAWDANQPNTPITVDIYDGSTLLGTVSANQFRQDLLNAGIGNGYHGFGFSLPASVRDGALHSINIRYGGTTTSLGNSPRSIECRSLSISKNGTGSGTVTSSPAGVQCGSTCAYWFPRNTTVTMAASPAANSIFAGWSGQSDCSDGTVSLSSNRSCTATFDFDSNADARLIWLQPQSLAGFGPPGSLVMAGSATGAPAGSRVQVSWRNVTTSGPWTTNGYQPLPNGSGIWYSSVPNANTSQLYEVRFTYGGLTWPSCTYPGTGLYFPCP